MKNLARGHSNGCVVSVFVLCACESNTLSHVHKIQRQHWKSVASHRIGTHTFEFISKYILILKLAQAAHRSEENVSIVRYVTHENKKNTEFYKTQWFASGFLYIYICVWRSAAILLAWRVWIFTWTSSPPRLASSTQITRTTEPAIQHTLQTEFVYTGWLDAAILSVIFSYKSIYARNKNIIKI